MPIHYEKDDEHIVLITIDRPEAKNSADMEHFKQLRESWDRFAEDGDAWVAIITGVRDAFFTGADLKRYIPRSPACSARSRGGAVAEFEGYRLDDGTKAVLRGAKIWKPIVAAVNGFCTAGGMEMLGGVDIRGRVPRGEVRGDGAQARALRRRRHDGRLPRQIPFPQAMEFLLCADLIPAQRAYEMGFLNAIVPREELLDKAYEFARRYGERAARRAGDQAERVGGPRHVPVGGLPQRVGDLLVHLPDRGRKEGPKAFAEKRPPKWQGRWAPGAPMTDPRTPCLIGVGQHTWHPDEVGEAGAPEPLEMWEDVARRAATTAGSAPRRSRASTRSTSFTARPGSTTTRPAGSPTGSAPTRPVASTRGSGGRPRRCSCRRRRSASSAASATSCSSAARRRSPPSAVQEAGSAIRTRSSPPRSAAVSVGGTVPPVRARPPGLCRPG